MSKGTPKDISIVKAQKASKNPHHDPFERINKLPQEQYELVVAMLKAHSPYAVAKTIQRDWKQCLDVTELTLAHQLEKFRAKTIPPSEMLNPYVIAKLTEQVRRNVNVISEQSSLIEMQMERLRQARLEEVESGTLLASVDRQTTILNRLLKNYSDTAYKTGLIDMFVSDFRKLTELEGEQHIFSMEKLYWSAFRGMYQEDPENFEDNLRQMLITANS